MHWQSEKEGLLGQDATPAIDALFKFIKDIESLYHFKEEQKATGLSKLEVYRAAVRAARSCMQVYGQFKSLYDKSKGLMNKSSQVCTIR